MVWQRLGDVDNYIEPFAGTLATLLRRPNDHTGKVETVNDASHWIANFWRAVAADPDAVAEHADWPVCEADLHARHRWLMGGAGVELLSRMAHDPDAYDAKLAGWWCWGQCCWIGGGWCSGHGKTADGDTQQRRQSLGNDLGVNCGVAAASPSLGRPQLGDVYDIGRGVLSNRHAGTVQARREWLAGWMRSLSDRLRLVRTCYGDWNRICGSRTTTTRIGLTGVFLDPPYALNCERLWAIIRHLTQGADYPAVAKSSQRHGDLYANDKHQDLDDLVARVSVWCRDHGDDPLMRIAVCGYEGEHDWLEGHGWEAVAWKAHGGYGNRKAGNENKTRERIWFSPHCLSDGGAFGLFAKGGDA